MNPQPEQEVKPCAPPIPQTQTEPVVARTCPTQERTSTAPVCSAGAREAAPKSDPSAAAETSSFEAWWMCQGARTMGDPVDYARAGWEAAARRIKASNPEVAK